MEALPSAMDNLGGGGGEGNTLANQAGTRFKLFFFKYRTPKLYSDHRRSLGQKQNEVVIFLTLRQRKKK